MTLFCGVKSASFGPDNRMSVLRPSARTTVAADWKPRFSVGVFSSNHQSLTAVRCGWPGVGIPLSGKAGAISPVSPEEDYIAARSPEGFVDGFGVWLLEAPSGRRLSKSFLELRRNR